MGNKLFEELLQGLQKTDPITSIRLNPFKLGQDKTFIIPNKTENVPWCKSGLYLNDRPNFTFDPLLHAGVYYAQEASSMFLEQVIRQVVTQPVTMLDLCAAPGGKSTVARSVLPAGSLLFANEPIHPTGPTWTSLSVTDETAYTDDEGNTYAYGRAGDWYRIS